MSFYGALFVWLIIAALFTVGIVMATQGSLLMLLVCLLLFVLAFAKWGCATH